MLLIKERERVPPTNTVKEIMFTLYSGFDEPFVLVTKIL